MKIALVGNQNSGKTTLFNLLTGSNQKVGNWPGVTIERKSGTIKGTDIELIDLPGIYSLSPYSAEEEISRNFIFSEEVELIINIIDASQLERSLYLTTQLLELDIEVLVVLNMADILDKKGVKIDVPLLSKELGVDVLQISALKKLGIDKLIHRIRSNKIQKNKHIKIFNDDMEDAIGEIESKLATKHKRFVAIKLLEEDPMFQDIITQEVKARKFRLEKIYQTDAEELIASGRYDWIDNIKHSFLKVKSPTLSISDRIDRIFLHKYFAIPIFVVIMFLVYFLSVGVVGGWTVTLFENLFTSFSEWFSSILANLGASDWSTSLIIDGIVVGVGATLTFVPQLIILFFCISILETTGYMSRIALLFDKFFRKFGLSGKALVPFIVGSGCSVPGIMSTRTIENPSERKMSIMLTPFIPCSAKLPILALFAGYFFGEYAGVVSASLYFLAIIIIMFSAIILKKYVFVGKNSSFISELPEYKAPNFHYTFKDVSEKTFAFVKRAGTIILFSSVVIWFLLSFSWRFEYGVDIENSILASIGNALAWIFYPFLGKYSWAASVSAIQGIVAKEQVVSSMAVINGLSSDVVDGSVIFSATGVFSFFTGPSAIAFIVFNLFSAPCFASIGAMRKEFGSTKDMFFAIGFQTGLAWIMAVIVYWSGTLIGVLF